MRPKIKSECLRRPARFPAQFPDGNVRICPKREKRPCAGSSLSEYARACPENFVPVCPKHSQSGKTIMRFVRFDGVPPKAGKRVFPVSDIAQVRRRGEIKNDSGLSGFLPKRENDLGKNAGKIIFSLVRGHMSFRNVLVSAKAGKRSTGNARHAMLTRQRIIFPALGIPIYPNSWCVPFRGDAPTMKNRRSPRGPR